MSLKRGIGPRSTSPLTSLGLYLRASDRKNARQEFRQEGKSYEAPEIHRTCFPSFSCEQPLAGELIV